MESKLNIRRDPGGISKDSSNFAEISLKNGPARSGILSGTHPARAGTHSAPIWHHSGTHPASGIRILLRSHSIVANLTSGKVLHRPARPALPGKRSSSSGTLSILQFCLPFFKTLR